MIVATGSTPSIGDRSVQERSVRSSSSRSSSRNSTTMMRNHAASSNDSVSSRRSRSSWTSRHSRRSRKIDKSTEHIGQLATTEETKEITITKTETISAVAVISMTTSHDGPPAAASSSDPSEGIVSVASMASHKSSSSDARSFARGNLYGHATENNPSQLVPEEEVEEKEEEVAEEISMINKPTKETEKEHEQQPTKRDESAGHNSSDTVKSIASSIKLPVTSIEPVAIESLPWTDDDKKFLLQQVAFWKNCLLEDENRLPKEDVRDILKSLYSFLRLEQATRGDRLLREISYKIQNMKGLDLHRLIELMEDQRKAGDTMADKDVILLTGAVGSGKTTTLHFLAGTQFEEKEVDGFLHLEPVSVKDARIEGYTTSCGRYPMTKVLQAVPVHFKHGNTDELVVICDVPGIGSVSTVEEELAFHYGMGPAIDRARRVKPVVVLNEELMGACFSNLPDALRLMKQEMSIKSPRDLKPVDYVFTHYEERHRTRLHQQFASLQSNGGLRYRNDQTVLFEELVNDVIAKTTPDAKLIMPLDDDPHDLLRSLWKESFVEDPQGVYCQDLPTDSALKQLYVQLQITLEEVKTALSREAYGSALDLIVLLGKVSIWFPQGKQTAQLAKEAACRQVNTIWEWMAKEIVDCHYVQVLARMDQLDGFGVIFPDAQSCSKRGNELLWESMVAPMEEHDYVLTMERICKLSGLSERYTPASQCVKRALRLLRKKISSSIEEGNFKGALALLIPLSSLSDTVPEADECAKNILLGLKQSMETCIAIEKDYPIALDLISRISSLKLLYPQVTEIAECGMSLCRRMLESSIVQADYDSALFLVQHMQRLQTEFPQAGEIAEYGLGIFSTAIEVLIEREDYKKAILLMQQISEEVLGSEDLMLKGISQIRVMLEAAIKNERFKSALETIYKVNILAKTVPEAYACIEHGFTSIQASIMNLIEGHKYENAIQLMELLSTGDNRLPLAKECTRVGIELLEVNIMDFIESHKYEDAIQLMELLSAGDNRIPLAKECTRVGIEVLKKNVSKAIEKKNYSPALDMIQQLSGNGHKIPGVGECSRRGLEQLSEAAQKAISDRDYATAIEIINNLGELTQTIPESKHIALLSLQAIVGHITELRQNVEKTVEEVAATRDLKVFVAMLLKLKSQMDKVNKSEPLRKLSVQLHYKKNFRAEESEASGGGAVLFVPQLYTSQAFCSDQIELLAGGVRDKLPAFDVNDACMETLIRSRKVLLSGMIRLKATHKILQHCPGGEKASLVYTNTFGAFHALLETVLAVAEDSFKPPIDMRVFELQAWFLSVLIKGFIKDKIDVGSDERKQMEELESRRRVLMLHFEVKMTEAIELLSEPDFVVAEETSEVVVEPLKSIGLVIAEETNEEVGGAKKER